MPTDATLAAFEESANGVVPPVAKEDSGSLRDHEAEFGKPSAREAIQAEAPEPKDDDAEPFNAPNAPKPAKYRAKSQQAKPEDVKTIDELTRRLRKAEEEAGFSIERQDGESERVFSLRRRAEQAEMLRDAKKAISAKPEPIAAPAPRPAPSDFAEAEPTIEQFAATADPYTAYTRALGAWDRRKEAWDQQQAALKTSITADQAVAKQRREAAYASHGQRVHEFRAKTADYDTVIQSASEIPTSMLTETAIVNHPKSAQMAYALAKDPALATELFFATLNSPVDRTTVALQQRLLETRLSAALTGSAAPVSVVPPPRPPNPVRTGAMRTVEAEPDDDTGSLSDHEKHYYNPRRRRA